MRLSEAIANQTTVKGPRCTVGRLLATLSPEDAADLAAALADEGVPGSHVAHALKDIGHDVAAVTVQRHKRGDCLCGR